MMRKMAFKILYKNSLDFKSKYYYMSIESIPIKELRKLLRQHKIRGVGKLNKKELMELIEGNKEVLEGAGFFDTLRRFGTSVSKGVSRAVSLPAKGLKRIFTPSKWWNNTSENTLSKFGNDNVIRIQIYRTPLGGMLNTLMSALSFGKIDELKKKYGYDKFYHLSLIATVMTSQGEKNIIVEKNEAPFITTVYETSELTEMMSLDRPIPPNFSLKNMLDNTIASVGVDRFFLYDAFTTNCQMFLVDILKTNGLLTEKAREFIYQDMTQLAEELPQAFKGTARALTDVGAVVSKLRGKGNGDEYARARDADKPIETRHIPDELGQYFNPTIGQFTHTGTEEEAERIRTELERGQTRRADRGLDTGFIESDIIEPPSLSDTSQLPAFSGAGDPSLLTFDLREIENYNLTVNPLSTSTKEEIELQQDLFILFARKIREKLYKDDGRESKRKFIISVCSIIREFVKYILHKERTDTRLDREERVIRNFKSDTFGKDIDFYVDFLEIDSGTRMSDDEIVEFITRECFGMKLPNGERLGRYIAFDIIDRFLKDPSKQPHYLDFIKDKGTLRPDYKKILKEKFREKPYNTFNEYVKADYYDSDARTFPLDNPVAWSVLTVSDDDEVEPDLVIHFFRYYCSRFSELMSNNSGYESEFNLQLEVSFLVNLARIIVDEYNRGTEWVVNFSVDRQNVKEKLKFMGFLRNKINQEENKNDLYGLINSIVMSRSGKKDEDTVSKVIRDVTNILIDSTRYWDKDVETNFISNLKEILNSEENINYFKELKGLKIKESIQSTRSIDVSVVTRTEKDKFREKYKDKVEDMMKKNPSDDILIAFYNNNVNIEGKYKCLNIVDKVTEKDEIETIKKIYREEGKNYLFICCNNKKFRRNKWKDKEMEKYYNIMKSRLNNLKNYSGGTLPRYLCGVSWDIDFTSCGCYVANLKNNILEITTISQWSIDNPKDLVGEIFSTVDTKKYHIYIAYLCSGGGGGEIFKQINPDNIKKFLETENEMDDKVWSNLDVLSLGSVTSFNTLNFYFNSGLSFVYEYSKKNVITESSLEYFKEHFDDLTSGYHKQTKVEEDYKNSLGAFSSYDNVLRASPYLSAPSKSYYFIYNKVLEEDAKKYVGESKKSFNSKKDPKSDNIFYFIFNIMLISRNYYKGESKKLYYYLMESYSSLGDKISKIKYTPMREPRKICEDDYIKYIERVKPEGGAKIIYHPTGSPSQKDRKDIKYRMRKIEDSPSVLNTIADHTRYLVSLVYLVYSMFVDYNKDFNNESNYPYLADVVESFIPEDEREIIRDYIEESLNYEKDDTLPETIDDLVSNTMGKYHSELGVEYDVDDLSSGLASNVDNLPENDRIIYKRLKKILVYLINGILFDNSNMIKEDEEMEGDGFSGGAKIISYPPQPIGTENRIKQYIKKYVETEINPFVNADEANNRDRHTIFWDAGGFESPHRLSDIIVGMCYIVYSTIEKFGLDFNSYDQIRLLVGYVEDYLDPEILNFIVNKDKRDEIISEIEGDGEMHILLTLMVFHKELNIPPATSVDNEIEEFLNIDEVREVFNKMKKIMNVIRTEIIRIEPHKTSDDDDGEEMEGDGFSGGAKIIYQPTGKSRDDKIKKVLKREIDRKVNPESDDDFDVSVYRLIYIIYNVCEDFNIDVFNDLELNLIVNYADDYLSYEFKNELQEQYMVDSDYENDKDTKVAINYYASKTIDKYYKELGLTLLEDNLPTEINKIKDIKKKMKKIAITIYNIVLNKSIRGDDEGDEEDEEDDVPVGEGLYGGEKKNYDVLVMTHNKIKDLPF